MKHYEIVNTTKKLKRLRERMLQLSEYAYDVETNTLKVNGDNADFRLVGISISWGDYDNYYIPINHRRIEDRHSNVPISEVVKYLKEPFEREDVRIATVNGKFDRHAMMRVGINIKSPDIFDSMVASWLCDENNDKGLKPNALHRLRVKMTEFNEVIDIPNDIKKSFGLKSNNKATFDLALIKDGAPYALADAFYTWKLYIGYIKELEDEGMLDIYNKKYIDFLDCLFWMEERGVVVDKEKLDWMSVEIAKDCDSLMYKMFELLGEEFNPNSGIQKAEILFGFEKQDSINKKSGKVTKAKPNHNLIAKNFGFKPISETPTGIPQVNGDVLFKIVRQYTQKPPRQQRKREGVEFCKLLSEYSGLQKLRSAFIEGSYDHMYDDGKVHPSFNAVGTDSGRVSCKEPNLMQIPSSDDDFKYQIRDLYVGSINPETGERCKIISSDFSNLEVRVLTQFSNDEKLIEMFLDEQDVHGTTAVNMFELDCTPAEVKKKYPHLRQAAKIIGFLLFYGGSAKTLYEKLRDDPYAPVDLGAKEYLDEYDCKNGVEVAQAYIDKYFATYSGVAEFMKTQKRKAHKEGYVMTLWGRKRRLAQHLNSRNYGDVSYGERVAINATIQGSASDIMVSAQLRIHHDKRLEELGCRTLIQVHDELVMECPECNVKEAIDIIRYHMENMFGEKTSKLVIPFTCSIDFADSYQGAK